MLIVGISAFYHDAAAVLLQDGEIIAAAQEERFTRIKHDAAFPTNAIQYCLRQAGCSLSDLDAVAYYEKPFLKFERLLESYYENAPRGLSSFIASMPVWIKEKLFLKKMLRDELKAIENTGAKKIKLLFPEHHCSHAASAFFASGYERAAILTIDGVGEWTTASMCLGEGNTITVLKELAYPHSLGLLYSAFTYFCGFKVNSGEYKLMGLAPYGNAGSERVQRFVEIIKTKLIDLKEDGSVFLNQRYFRYATSLRMVDDKAWEKLFGLPKRSAETALDPAYCDLALAVQQVTTEAVLKMAVEVKKLTNADHLCMAGGVALNCTANGQLHDAKLFKEIFIQPAAGDAGGALGAAYAAHYIYFDQPRPVLNKQMDFMKGALLGPSYTESEIVLMSRKYKATYERIDDEEQLLQRVAQLLANGNIIGWHQGRMEFGPRSLGARSILADARRDEMQKTLNLKTKFRESFRPFAPAVLAEEVSAYFQHQGSSPYMLLVKPVAQHLRLAESGTNTAGLTEKLYARRSVLPAITHVDYSARIQTVHKETNPLFWNLLNAFKQLTGCPVLVNTSFNVRGEPIVNTPEDAYRCFMRTQIDFLVVGNFIFAKSDQPPWPEKDNWQQKFTLD